MPYLESYLEKTPRQEWNKAVIAHLAGLDQLKESCPLAARAIESELRDQRHNLKLIASENFSSLTVQLAMGNLLTDKYAEGYPGHRFYAGCKNIDEIEEGAAELLKKIFRCGHAYVQPHSGADANLVALWSILIHRVQEPEVRRLEKKTLNELSDAEYEAVRQKLVSQKVMGMSLNSGGHLTHGYRHNVSSKMVQAVSYDVDPKTGLLDYSALHEQAKKERPAILIAGYSAYPRKINFAKMREIADAAGSTLLVDMAHFAGLVAGKVFSGDFDPVPHAHFVTSTTHKTLRGPRGGIVLCQEEFKETLNKGCPLVLGGPLPHVMAAKLVAFQEVDTPAFCAYAEKVVENARSLAEVLMNRGAPVLTGGTDNHLVLIDVSRYGISGKQAEEALRRAGITVNRNAVPNDPNGPWYTSGIRIGSPAITTLGMGREEMEEIARLIVLVLSSSKPLYDKRKNSLSRALSVTESDAEEEAKRAVSELLERYPLYPELQLASEQPA